MELLSALISETLRLYPSVVDTIMRKSDKDHMLGNLIFVIYLLGKFKISKETFLQAAIVPVMNSSAYMDDPEKFDLSRWTSNQ
jgi:cytochrome P450